MASQNGAINLANSSDAATLRSTFVAILASGKTAGLVGQRQISILQTGLEKLDISSLNTLKGLLGQAGSQTQQFFILKAYAAGESWANLQDFASQIRSVPDATIAARCTMRGAQDITQQWQDTCGPTVIETAAGELDPRFAWELHKLGDVTRVDPTGAEADVAAQQKQWLETYGGRAVQRGQTGGTGIALDQILNDMIGPMLGCKFQAMQVSSPAQGISAIEGALGAGFDVPLRISWSQPGSGTDEGHFVLAMNVRSGASGRELQIHDPWTGRTDWIAESSIANNSFAPIFNEYGRLSHVYVPVTA